LDLVKSTSIIIVAIPAIKALISLVSILFKIHGYFTVNNTHHLCCFCLTPPGFLSRGFSDRGRRRGRRRFCLIFWFHLIITGGFM